MTLSLKAEKRTQIGNLGDLRKQGFLPAVYYGHKQASTPIQLRKNDFLKIWKEAGESTVVKLETDTGGLEALIHEVTLDPLSNEPEHADFYVFEKGHKVEISVPIEFVGTSPAVKEKGAVLMKILHELKIKAEPANLPHHLDIDIGNLVEFGDQVSAKDIKLPAGVELEENKEEIIATVSEPKEEKEEEVLPVDLSQIEVEKKGKKEEESAESSGEPTKEASK
ncbi:MAG: 50S ribosomal protein L25 [Patescibacteria group bacterium]